MNIIKPGILPPPRTATFCGNSTEFRKKYTQRLENNQLSETNISNLKGLTNAFSQEGLTYQDVLKAAKSNPFILFHKPATMKHNIRETAQRFSKYGLTAEKYLHCALNNPALFSSSRDTVQKNINETVKLFENYGLTTERYLQNAQTSPNLFTSKPQTIKKKIYKIADTLNISTSDILEMFMKQPSQFNCSEKEIIKKYEIFKYIEENKLFDTNQPRPSEREFSLSILRKKFTNSTDTSFMQLLRNKISNRLKKGKKLPHFNLETSLKDYIAENKRSTIEFTITDGKYAKDFIKFVRNFSKASAGKNIFKISIIK